MMQPIQPLGVPPLPQVVRATNGLPAGPAGGPSFGDVLARSLERLDANGQQVPVAAGNSLVGDNLTAGLAALEQTGGAPRMAIQVGDRLLAAYEEIKDLRI